jgi:uracil-DNA glycosylase
MRGPATSDAESRFRLVFRAAHAHHAVCAADEWLNEPCRDTSGTLAERPLVWSRRNGAWRRVEILWIGAAPGNAGGLGTGERGAHGTRIPFGGDIAGGNLDALFSSIGLDRNDTFIVAALNQLPERGGGEPSAREIGAPVGAYPDSIALLRDTIIAAGPTLIVALGNVALRVLAAAVTRPCDAPVGEPGTGADGGAPAGRMPGLKRLAGAGLQRGRVAEWPVQALPLAEGFSSTWRDAWGAYPAFRVLPLLHPSAQNMSPFAGEHTVFHQRMIITRDALHAAIRNVFGRSPPQPRPGPPTQGIYALPEWQKLVAPALQRYDELWRQRGV